MENLGWGLQMTALGMGLVFALLALLWGLLTLVLKFDPIPAEPASPPGAAAAGAERIASVAGGEPVVVHSVDGMDAAVVAAITIAVLRHKAVGRREAAPSMRLYWPGSLLYASRWVASGRARQNRSWHRGR